VFQNLDPFLNEVTLAVKSCVELQNDFQKERITWDLVEEHFLEIVPTVVPQVECKPKK
jgi:hypothetical protein